MYDLDVMQRTMRQSSMVQKHCHYHDNGGQLGYRDTQKFIIY